jgi:hypothetical protein
LTLPLTESPLTANVMVGVPPPLGSVTVAFHVPAIDFACFDWAAAGFHTSSMVAMSDSNEDLTVSSWRWYEG